MIRFTRDPQPPYTQYKQGMVRDLGASLEAIFIASLDAVLVTPPNLVFPPPKGLLPAGQMYMWKMNSMYHSLPCICQAAPISGAK